MSKARRNLPFEVENFWYLYNDNPQLKILANDPDEKIENADPLDVLLRWANFQAKKASQTWRITNFSEDFRDCLALVNIMIILAPKIDFDSVLEEIDLDDRANLFVKLIKETSYRDEVIKPNDIKKVSDKF